MSWAISLVVKASSLRARTSPGAVKVTNELFFRHTPPADRKRVREAIARAIAEKASYSVEHRIIRKPWRS
ncbi:MAG: PAS domain-containing protein [Endomicrobiales bacterium]